jgi:hypothetical protein
MTKLASPISGPYSRPSAYSRAVRLALLGGLVLWGMRMLIGWTLVSWVSAASWRWLVTPIALIALDVPPLAKRQAEQNWTRPDVGPRSRSAGSWLICRRQILRSAGPRKDYRDNLRTDLTYITARNNDAGLANQLISQMNLLHAGAVLDRTVLVCGRSLTARTSLKPPCRPGINPSIHWKQDRTVPLGEIFDLERFQRETRITVADWSDVQKTRLSSSECHADSRHSSARGIQADTFEHLKLVASEVEDEQLLCFEDCFLFHELQFHNGKGAALGAPLDWVDPVWKSVGRHMHFMPQYTKLADELLQQTLGSRSKCRLASESEAGLIPLQPSLPCISA